jgi:two-component system, cell cycle sensor histidine kinase and response regulator CckA
MPPRLGSSSTILVVDDEPAVLNLAKLILETAGYAVLAAGNGRQALAFVENQNYSIDLLLTDINMPGISGLELACRVSEIRPHLPVMFMTGSRADSPGIELLRREGPFSDCDVISKPFTSTELLGEVSGIVPNNAALSMVANRVADLNSADRKF